MQTYQLEIVDCNVVARIYVDGQKTSAYTTVIPDEIKKEAEKIQQEWDNEPF